MKDSSHSSGLIQFSTFSVAGRKFGIDVTAVQEVVKPMKMTYVPLAPEFVKGLINLRGQVATAIGLRQLFKLPTDKSENHMNVVCQTEGSTISLMVDEIGDVIEVPEEEYEPTPSTISNEIRPYMKGVYKISGDLLSILDLNGILTEVSTEISD